jgi:ankyrin repeat protein
VSIFRKQDRLNWSLGSTIYYRGSAADVEKKIEAGADVNGIYKNDYYKKSMLRWAVDRNDSAIVRLLLSKGADPNAGPDNDKPLMTAVSHSNLDVVRALLEAGATIEVMAYGKETPLIVAAAAGSAEIVKLLVERGADVNAQNASGNTALHMAATRGYANLARFLMENGAKPDMTNGNMNTAADVAEKEYPGLAAMIRGKAQPDAPVEADPGWKLVAAHEVAHVEMKEAVGYRVTEIFNFAARTYTHIAANLETKAESQSVKAFCELDSAEYVDKAYRELTRLGGKTDYADTGKKKLQTPGL